MNRRIPSLLLGPLLFLILWIAQPFGLDATQSKVIGLVLWMLWWWIGEVVPMGVTSLVPLIVLPLSGILSLEKTAMSYSNRFVFLFLGGFMIAIAMEKWNLHRRIALSIVRKTGTNANRIVFGFFLASFLISMWISNTATTLMMLPIAGSVVKLLIRDDREHGHRGTRNFATTMMLAIAYGASIGGIGTLVGSPPNASMAGILDKTFHYHVGFFEWMKFGLPFAFALMLMAYVSLVYVVFPNKLGKFTRGQEILDNEFLALGPWTKAQRIVFGVFLTTALLWIFQDSMAGMLQPYGIEFTDTAVALIMGSLLFLWPSKEADGEMILMWKDTQQLPWGVLLMFGGGMALATAFDHAGLVGVITEKLRFMQTQDPYWPAVWLSIIGLIITALMSNIAMVNIFVPIVAGLAVASGQSPMAYALPVTIAASCDFMFPMSTPPNAIVAGSGYIKNVDMLKAGLVLNAWSILLLMVMIYFMV
ncbi:MAG: SLC13 family permease [Flavobacteriales bacterium]